MQAKLQSNAVYGEAFLEKWEFELFNYPNFGLYCKRLKLLDSRATYWPDEALDGEDEI